MNDEIMLHGLTLNEFRCASLCGEKIFIFVQFNNQ